MSAAPKLNREIKFDIQVTKGPHIGLMLSFEKAQVSIGRGPENDIVLSSDPRVSRHHADIKARDNDYVIVNVSQKNFVLVNGESIQSEVIKRGSVIQIGDTEIQFQCEEVAAPEAAPPVLTPATPVSQARPQSILTPTATKPTTNPMPSYGQPQPMQQYQQQMPQYHQQAYAGHSDKTTVYHGNMSSSSSGDGLLSNPRVRFYGIIALVGLFLWFILSPSGKKAAKDPNAFRTSAISMQEVAEAEKRTQELLTVKKEKYDSIQYRRAQENFVRGFRDFQQGQYARSREAFQVVLNLDPDNELAKRYYNLSKIKFDELVKFNMIQGNRYREKRNWRMCQSSYTQVMTMLQTHRDDPSYKEAKQYFEECTLNLEGRF
jgi:tetratricopeptide (TPR) repeat protein